jgi:hypothetical protein
MFLQTPDDGQNPETQKFLVLYAIVTTLQKLIHVYPTISCHGIRILFLPPFLVSHDICTWARLSPVTELWFQCACANRHGRDKTEACSLLLAELCSQVGYLVAISNDFHNEELQIDACLVPFIDESVKVAHFRACHRLPNVQYDIMSKRKKNH